MELLLANPRGFCAGVDRAIEIVERALALHGAPIYVRHEVVHNKFVVESLKAKGAIFVEELRDVPRGPMKLDDYMNPIQNIYIRKVERVGGELQNTVIQTYPNVSQFWTYKPEEFLKQPVYSRDYPPLKP